MLPSIQKVNFQKKEKARKVIETKVNDTYEKDNMHIISLEETK